MILESCQMLSIVYSKHYWDCGDIHKSDGTAFKTEKGAFKNHPCTQWAAADPKNCAWLIVHAEGLLEEYEHRYNKTHSLSNTVLECKRIFHRHTGRSITCHKMVDTFTRAMPDEYKLDTSIDTVTAYKMYVASKPWVKNNYLRCPDRKPEWV